MMQLNSFPINVLLPILMLVTGKLSATDLATNNNIIGNDGDRGTHRMMTSARVVLDLLTVTHQKKSAITCIPVAGTVIVTTSTKPSYSQFEDAFDWILAEYNQPVTLIDWEVEMLIINQQQKTTIASQSTTFSLNSSNRIIDGLIESTVCNNVLIFCCPSPINFLFNKNHLLSLIYNQLSNRYRLNRFVVVNDDDQINEVISDAFLYETSNENLFVVSSSRAEIHHWRVTDNQIHRIPFASKYYENLMTKHRFPSKFSNRHLHIATIDYPPVTMLTPVPDGIEIQLIALIAQDLNFTFDYNRSLPDQMWDGLYKLLTEKRVDVALGDMFMHNSLRHFYAFSLSYKINYEGFLVPIPRAYAKWTALIYPLSVIVWVASLLSVLAAILALYFLTKCITNTNGSRNNDFTLYVIGNLLGVSQSRRIDSSSQRFFLIAWLSAATIISTAYRSSFISLVTWPKTPPPIDTIHQLADSPLGKTSFLDLRKEMLLNSIDPHRQRLGEQWFKSANTSHMMSLLDTDQWAIDSTFDHLLYLISTNYPSTSAAAKGQRFRLMKQTFSEERSCMYLQKNSALKPYFDKSIQLLIETGFYNHLRSKFCKTLNNYNPSDQQKNNQRIEPFSLDHMQGAFYLLAIGIIVSFIVFIFEILVYIWL